MSETSLCRHIIAPFCQGNGCDVGSGGDPVVPWAIQVDLPDEAFIRYGHAHEETKPIQYRGDARNLPFKDGTMAWLLSSHLIEDFDDWPTVLEEFVRVLKPDGHLIIMVPDRKLFRAAVAAGQNDNASHRHEFHVGELTEWARMRGGFEVIFDQLTLVRGPKDYNILFVAKKKVKPIVVIPAFDRTELFSECLHRLEKNEYEFDVLVAPDKSITRDAIAIDEIIQESELRIKTLPRPPLRLGADKNTINAVNAASDMGYSHLICLGGDILVSENFVHDLMALSVKFDAFAAIPTTGRHSLDVKLEHVNSLVYGANTGQNFCCPVHIWRNISPLVTAISDRFYKIKYDAHEHWCQRLVMRVLLDAARKIETPFTKPMLDHMDANEIGTSEDGLITTVLAMYGIPMVSYAINRASHPSDTGVNTTKEHYDQHYAGVVIDALPKADPEKFKFIG